MDDNRLRIFAYEEHPDCLKLFSLGYGRLRGDLIAAFCRANGLYSFGPVLLFELGPSNTQGDDDFSSAK